MKERLFSFFKMNRLIPVIFCLFFATSIYAQNREVKGIVTGDDNEPMAGATIKIKTVKVVQLQILTENSLCE